MTDATATFCDVSLFDNRAFPRDECRRIVRLLIRGAVISFTGVAASCAIVTTATIAAAWIVNIALTTNPNGAARTSIRTAAIMSADHHRGLAAATWPSPSLRVSAAFAGTQAFEDKPALATTPAFAIGQAEDIALQPRFTSATSGKAQSLPAEAAHAHANNDVRHQLAELAPVVSGSEQPSPAAKPRPVVSVPLPRPAPVTQDIARARQVTRQVTQDVARQLAMATPDTASISEERAGPQQSHNRAMSLPDADSHSAIYVIAAHTVYLPNGETLEAHSGLGDKLDDPRYVDVKNRGPTPPNVYDLALREQLFHGVQAVRLNPVDEGKMFGRDGMLAHTYMLGRNGQSNGCVSFKDYPKFLHAVLRGEVDRLVVVKHLSDVAWRTAGVRRVPSWWESGNRS